MPVNELNQFAKQVINTNDTGVFALTDMGNAERLINRYAGDIRHCLKRGKWLHWTGNYWQWDEINNVEQLAKKTVRAIFEEALQAESDRVKDIGKHAVRSENAARVRAMIELAKSEPGVPILLHELDTNPWLLNVRNGTLDLRSGELYQPRKSDLITKRIDIEYDPGAHHSTWLEFLNKVMGGNPSLIRFLQQAVGYSLTGDTREQCLFFLYGRGANGKTTFIEAISGLLGAYCKHTRPETFMAKKSDGVPNDLAELESVRMVAAVELEEGRRLAEVLTKQVSGGDTLKARYLFQEFFEYRPQFKLWLCGNHKPRIHGTDHAIWRRIKLIPWTVTIPDNDQDKNLPNKLKEEWPGILAWAVQGCLDWQANGLSTPDEVQAATADYRKEQDILGDFFDNCVIKETSETVTVKELYEAYKKFCDDNGEAPKDRLGKKKFNERVRDRGFDQYPAKGNVFTWYGIGLRNG
jgi:putative DNA primase/helicase